MSAIALHVGSYAKRGGQGLYPLRYDPLHGFDLGPPLGEPSDMSFAIRSSRHDLAYMVEERADGAVGAWRRDGTGWRRVAHVPTLGDEPCFAALDPAETRLAVANYASGSLTLYDLDERGLPIAPGGCWAGGGKGPHPHRQEAPHIHCVRFAEHGGALYAVDLGTDRILRFALDGGALPTAPAVAYRAPPGSGPRHLFLHPSRPAALLVSELASRLTLLDLGAKGMTARADRSTLPDDHAGDSLGGHLAIDAGGTRAYVTNRGHDSIAVFALDADRGTLDAIQHVPSGGASPRFFLLLEDVGRLIVAHEEDGAIVAFAIAADGRLDPTGHRVTVPGAAHILRG